MSLPLRRTVLRLTGWWVLTVLAVAACAHPEDRPDRPPLDVELVRTFGQPAPDHPRAAELGADPDSGASPVVLGATAGLAIGSAPDQRLYVADRLNRQLLAFEPEGALAWTRELPEGDGPGEMRLPTAVAVSPENRILVLDRRQGRILEFDEARPGARTISLDFSGGLWGLEVDSLGELWALTSGGRRARSSGVRLKPDGSLVDRVLQTSERDREFGGRISDLTITPGGRVLAAHRQPGTWTLRVGDTESRQGAEAFPDVVPVTRDNPRAGVAVRTYPAATLTIGALPDDCVAILYRAEGDLVPRGWPGEPDLRTSDEERSLRWFVDLFGPGDQYLGTAQLPTEFPSLGPTEWSTLYGTFSPHTGHLFVTSYRPFPYVAELRIERPPGCQG